MLLPVTLEFLLDGTIQDAVIDTDKLDDRITECLQDRAQGRRPEPAILTGSDMARVQAAIVAAPGDASMTKRIRVLQHSRATN